MWGGNGHTRDNKYFPMPRFPFLIEYFDTCHLSGIFEIEDIACAH